MNSSDSAGSRLEQSLSLSGMPAPSSADLRRVASRALRAARRARAALMALVTTLRASAGFSSNQSARRSLVARSTSERIETLPSLPLV